MIKRMFLSILGAGVVLTTVPEVVMACAVCLTGAGDDAVAEAFNLSVLFLMATPYMVIGSILGWVFFSRRRATATREPMEHGEPAVPLAWDPKESER